ncbi:MAG: Lrp/AsnC family transcriptional regulator [Candidatus Aminicenantaceae bacterium]
MIDDLDRKIVRVLNQNARKSFRDVAREVETSVTAVINRVKKLEESGFIKGYIPLVEPEYFGLNLIAIIALRISKGKLLETQKKIAKDTRVVSIYDITGEWDSFIIGYFIDRKDLNDFIKGLLSLEYVDRTVTHIVLNVVKEERRILV